MNAIQIIKTIKKDGWFLVRVVGSHHHFKHNSMPGLVTVPVHGKTDLHPAIVNNIFKVVGCEVYQKKRPTKRKTQPKGIINHNVCTNRY